MNVRLDGKNEQYNKIKFQLNHQGNKFNFFNERL